MRYGICGAYMYVIRFGTSKGTSKQKARFKNGLAVKGLLCEIDCYYMTHEYRPNIYIQTVPPLWQWPLKVFHSLGRPPKCGHRYIFVYAHSAVKVIKGKWYFKNFFIDAFSWCVLTLCRVLTHFQALSCAGHSCTFTHSRGRGGRWKKFELSLPK